MKNNHLYKKTVCLLFVVWSFMGYSQLINTSTSLPVDQLVLQSLGNDCVEITNVTSNMNGSVDGLNSFGSFTQGASSFPFSSGFFLSTGNGNRIGNTSITTDLSDGTTAWTGDSDLENTFGISNTVNATVIEFDLISTANMISFNYILASEEYQQNFPCNVGDGFALLLRPQGGTYQNIAVLPNSSTAVGIDTVHPEVVGQCLAENENFFAGQSLGDTNFEGRTVELTAAAAVIPNTVYHLKMVIADQSSFDPTAYDSAIFIEAGSLRAEVDLGPDLFPCVDATLDADIGNNIATYKWFRNNTELIGEVNSTILADVTGNYRVEITVALTGTNCIITDDVVVTIDPNQLNITIANQSLCDDASADGFETFDLQAIGSNALNQLPTGNYDYEFYMDQNDAQSNVNELANMYTNQSNPQTVFIRINDLNTGCQSIRPVVLEVNEVLVATDYTFTTCDEDVDGITTIDLSQFNTEVTSSVTNVNISYHSSANAAINNIGILSNSYTNGANPDTVYARITSTLSNCFATSEVTINIVIPPLLNSSLEEIDACDSDGDGFATFDITSVLPDFTTTASDYNITYHLSEFDAVDNLNPISNPTSFDNTIPRIQSVFIRFESIATGCIATGNVVLYTNLLLDRTNIQNVQICDDISNDGFETFGFDLIAIDFINGLENVDIEFFETEVDQMGDVNQIDPTIGYTNLTNPQTIYIRINSPTCTEFSDFEISVVPFFQSGVIMDQTYCDEDQDLITTVPLNEFDNAVRGSFGNDHAVLYYLTQTDADNRANPITTITNTVNPFTVFAELIAPTGCSDNQELQITILPAPVSGTPIGFIICDNDQDGFSVINLTSQESQITTDVDRAITYHNSFSDAEIGVNPINNSTSYNAQTETIFVRVEDLNNGCETVVQQSIIVNTLPLFTNITTYQLCEADGNEIEDFFLFTKDTEILNGQTGKSTSYYRSFTDADTSTNPINKFNAFQNTSNPQTIWVRVENDSDSSCYGVDSFLLQVDESPVYNIPADLRICDDDNDGISTFDLQQSIDMIRSGITANLTVSFHESALQANLNNNPLPLIFTNTTNPQTIYARIGNDVSCYEVEEILFNVIDSPLTNTVTPSTSCDVDLDGSTAFDLTSREADLVGTRPFNSTLSWHTSLIDAQNDVNPISNETGFINTMNPQIVYLRFFNTVSRCYDVGNLELIVNLPPQLNSVNDLLVCDNPLQTASLNEVIPQFIDPLPTGFLTSFYGTNQDAIDQTNQLSSDFNYTANNTNLFIRVENSNTSCFSISNFNLRIQAAPQIATPGSYELRACDTDFDDQHSFDLSINDSIILNGLDPSMHTVQYFTTLSDAENDSNQLSSNTVSVTVQDTYYVRVTNIALGCFSIGEFEVIVDPLPIVLVDLEYVICNNGFVTVDAFSEASGESYLWSTGEISSTIDINVPGNYSVQVTSSRGCASNPMNFTVIASQTPMVEFVASTNFGDPNTITVTVNGTGDYQYVLDNGAPQTSNIFIDVPRGYHEVSVIDLNGCTPSPPQLVLIIDYPRFFTPNNDGFNDTWYVDQIDTFDSATFSIFDRYGKLLKSYGKDFNGWDGLYNGNPMPSSDYWFLLEIKDSRGDIEVKGHFSLKR